MSSAEWKARWRSKNSCESGAEAAAASSSLERDPRGLDVVVGRQRGRAERHRRLDQAPQVVEARQVLQGEPGGERRALRRGLDEPFRLQPAQRLPDRDVADAEALLELADPDAAARLDLAGEDLAAEPLGDGVDDARAADRLVRARSLHCL